MSAHEALAELDSGVVKLWLMQRCLRAEARGGYEPILAEGAKADNVVAFSRGGRTVTIAPRFVARLDGDWSDTTLELPQAQWRDELSGREIAGGRQPLAELLSDFPMALLVRSDA
jgi:(1->4)-alpha-D-glucan 1-alpha-D-glucosylmutase